MKFPKASQVLTRPLFLFCTLALVVSFFLAPQGSGPALCGVYRLTGFPCFGCGMTRAITSISHLNLALAWQYHPWGLLLWPFMLVFGVVGIRASWSETLNQRIRKNDSWATPALWISVLLFLAFGIIRLFFADEWIGHRFH